MMAKFKNWLKRRSAANEPLPPPDLRKAGAYIPPRLRESTKSSALEKFDVVDSDDDLASTIDAEGDGKNVLIRNKYVREDTGTHETLKILDDSLIDSGEETGLDPYNTGGFDRSKNWDKRFRK